jgi:FtsP/CotA-like multicopper oxidase with cupredoxin domain
VFTRAVLVLLSIMGLAVAGPHPLLTATALPPPHQLAAADVAQPEGWDDDLALPQPIDLNPAPDVLEIELEARIAEVAIKPGVTTRAWTYNGTLPGPYIRATIGDRLIVHFRNSLPEPTTIHWHGLRVPNDMDGAPGMTQQPVPPGGTFRYEFVLRDAGTYWYHPHVDSSAQVGWGLYGPIVVTDPADSPAWGDDLVLVLSDISLDDRGQLLAKDNGGSFGDLFGREGSVLLVNGKVRPRLKVRAGKPQRWRFINAARARYYSFFLRGFTRLGGDNGLAARAEKPTRVIIVPGERIDGVLTPAFTPGSVVPLRWRPVDRGYGTAFNRPPEDVMDIETVPDAAVAAPAVPERLREIAPIDVRGAVEHTLDLTIASDEGTVEMGINGVPAWKAQPITARIGETHVWTVTNRTPFDHPFHLHGYFFQVMDDGRVPEWKDTVNVPVDGTMRLAVRFDERPGMWMYHCHILDHAEVGMMGHLHVE